ncbi:hypothetical protein HAX54_008368, partial [Datura stramonium]|nr:hypothetical protein [Datura stramonium]
MVGIVGMSISLKFTPLCKCEHESLGEGAPWRTPSSGKVLGVEVLGMNFLGNYGADLYPTAQSPAERQFSSKSSLRAHGAQWVTPLAFGSSTRSFDKDSSRGARSVPSSLLE